MGFLHKLWDETLAGPAPDYGLGKLRKCNTFVGSRPTVLMPLDDPPITRSITVVRKNNAISIDPDSPPAGSSFLETPPVSPVTPTGDFKNFSRRKVSTEESDFAQPRTPTVYDWIVISALDR